MRNPSRRPRYLPACLQSPPRPAGSAWSGITRAWADWVVIVLFAVVVPIVPFAPVLLIQGLLFASGKAKLDAGIGRVAQWHVAAEDWDRFRAFDRERVAAYGASYVNDLRIRQVTPPGGVAVIVGKTSLIVDHSYHVLRLSGLPELRNIGWVDNSATPQRPPDCLEFKLAYPRSRYGTITYTTLRVPIPEAAFGQARLAYYHFAPAIERLHATRPVALRNPIRTLQVCGVLLLVSLAAARLGVARGRSDGPEHQQHRYADGRTDRRRRRRDLCGDRRRRDLAASPQAGRLTKEGRLYAMDRPPST